MTLVVQFCCKKGRAASGWGFVAVDEARVLAAAVSFSGASGSDQARLPCAMMPFFRGRVYIYLLELLAWERTESHSGSQPEAQTGEAFQALKHRGWSGAT